MNFSAWKEDIFKMIVPALVTLAVWRINTVETKVDVVISKADASDRALVAMETKQNFLTYRADQQRDTVLKHGEEIAENRIAIGELKESLKQWHNTTR